jgi:hypothetical protein
LARPKRAGVAYEAAGAESSEADTEVDNDSDDTNLPVLHAAAKRARLRKASDNALLGISSDEDE